MIIEKIDSLCWNVVFQEISLQGFDGDVEMIFQHVDVVTIFLFAVREELKFRDLETFDDGCLIGRQVREYFDVAVVHLLKNRLFDKRQRAQLVINNRQARSADDDGFGHFVDRAWLMSSGDVRFCWRNFALWSRRGWWHLAF